MNDNKNWYQLKSLFSTKIKIPIIFFKHTPPSPNNIWLMPNPNDIGVDVNQMQPHSLLFVLTCTYQLLTISEITKDSSGSLSTSGSGVSGNENFSDDEMESALSSTSGIPSSKPSPMSPDRHFYNHKPPHNQPHASHNKQVPPAGKYEQTMDSRDGYRDNVYNNGDLPQRKRPSSGGRQGERIPIDRPLSGQKSKRRDYIEPEQREHVVPPGVHGSPYTDNGYDEILDNNEISPRKIRDDIPDSDLIDYEDDGEGESLVDDEGELIYDESKVSIFIALFDYDPFTMSPNPDAPDEELPFKEGQLIKVLIS